MTSTDVKKVSACYVNVVKIGVSTQGFLPWIIVLILENLETYPCLLKYLSEMIPVFFSIYVTLFIIRLVLSMNNRRVCKVMDCKMWSLRFFSNGLE